MTNKELFEQYGGQMLEYTYKGDHPCAEPGKFYRLCGYQLNGTNVLVEAPNGNFGSTFQDAYVILPNLPSDCSVRVSSMEFWKVPDQSSMRICCRCGNRYKNKREHNRTCK